MLTVIKLRVRKRKHFGWGVYVMREAWCQLESLIIVPNAEYQGDPSEVCEFPCKASHTPLASLELEEPWMATWDQPPVM